MIRDSKHQLFKVKYERLPDWCAVCGHLGHVYKEHGDGIHAPSALFFKELRAPWFMYPGAGPGCSRGRRGGWRRGQTNSRAGNMDAENFGQGLGEDNDLAVLDGDVDMLDPNRKRSAGQGRQQMSRMTSHPQFTIEKTCRVCKPPGEE